MHSLGRRHHVAEHSVHAEPDFYVSFVGFDVNIRRAVAHGLGEDQVYHLNNGGFACHFLEIGEVGRVVDLGGALAVAVAAAGETGQNLL